MEVLKERPAILDVVKSVSEENGIVDYVITDVKTNQKGEGYLGEIFMVTVKDSHTGKHFEFVIKSAFEDDKVREMANIKMAFQNEINFYENLLEVFDELERDCGIVNTPLAPECFQVRVEDKHEILALENLRSSGFEVFDKTKILDHDHVALIFQTYGRFHAYSFALRDQDPEEFNRLAKTVHNVFGEFAKKEHFAEHLGVISGYVEKTFTQGEDDEIIRKYQKYSGKKLSEHFADVINSDCDHSVILHGDSWSNNMMFKYKDTDNGKKPTEMRLIDWQLSKIGSPVLDLSYSLYSGASKKIFDSLNDYLEIYYKSLSSQLKCLGSDPDRVYPFSVLKSDWEKFSKFGMIMAFAIIRMKLTFKQDLLDFTDGFDANDMHSLFANMRVDEDGFSKRIKDLIWHMSDINAL